MEKLERDGMVAVLYSPGYGAGWSTRGGDSSMVFNKRLALAVLGESGEDVMKVAQEEYPNVYHGGCKDLEVQWVEKGHRFEINEYDGAESVRVFGPDDGYVA
jgi:hypothetical protein